MKKLILLTLFVISIGLLFAELEVDIPFNMDIVGPAFTGTNYSYESEWITVTNTGSTTQAYTLFYSTENLPAGWTMSVCRIEGTCFMPNFPSPPIPLDPQQVLQIHIAINVASTGAFDFPIIFDQGDLPEPMSLDFTFRTEDYVVSADDNVVVPHTLSNYPNPFNPSTTISYEISQQELASASITIYNTKGQLIRTFNNLNTSGNIVWNGKDNNNNIVNSGVYFYKLNSIKTSKARKMILIK